MLALELVGLLWKEIVAPAVEEGKKEKLLFSDLKGHGMDVAKTPYLSRGKLPDLESHPLYVVG